jgi:hypothetical protein
VSDALLSEDGYRLLDAIVDAGFTDLLPEELAAAIDDASCRVGRGCRFCGRDVETRYGACFECATAAELLAER